MLCEYFFRIGLVRAILICCVVLCCVYVCIPLIFSWSLSLSPHSPTQFQCAPSSLSHTFLDLFTFCLFYFSYYLSKDICRFVLIYELISRFKPLNSGHIHYRNKSNVLLLRSVQSLFFLLSNTFCFPHLLYTLWRHSCVDFTQLSALRIKFIRFIKKEKNTRTYQMHWNKRQQLRGRDGQSDCGGTCNKNNHHRKIWNPLRKALWSFASK